jgi:outer membrane immunogenic protein
MLLQSSHPAMSWLLRAAAAPLALAGLSAAGPAAAQDNTNPWTGFYLGGIVGGAWANTKAEATLTTGNGTVIIPPADAAAFGKVTANDQTEGGFTGGVEGGYDYQMGNWLFGVEGDWTSLDLKTTSHKTLESLVNPGTSYVLNQKIKTDWMVTLRPRVGYTMGPWLVFATAGLGFSELKYSANFFDNVSSADTLTADTKSTKTGWAAGLGGAYAFAPNLSLKGEWLYTDFGHVGTAETNSFVSITPSDSVKAHMFRVGLDYRF